MSAYHLYTDLSHTYLKFKAGVPIEVVPFAYAKVLQNLHQVLDSPKATLRMAVAKGILFGYSATNYTQYIFS